MNTQENPPRPQSTLPAPLSDWIDDLLEWLTDHRFTGGQGGTIADADGRGIRFNVDPVSQSVIAPHAFQLIKIGKDSVRVVYGTLEGVMPDGFSLGDSPQYVLTGLSGTGIIYLEVTTDSSGNITSRSVGFAGTMPADAAMDFHREIGSFGLGADGNLTIAQAIAGSQSFELCGGVTPLWGLT